MANKRAHGHTKGQDCPWRRVLSMIVGKKRDGVSGKRLSGLLKVLQMNWNQYIGRLGSTYLNGINYYLKRRKRDGLEDVKFENFRYHCVWGYVTIVQFLNLARQNGNHNYHYVQVTILHFQNQFLFVSDD